MDLKTLGLMYGLISLFACGTLSILYSVYARFAETKYWAIGSFLNAIAGVLFSLRSEIPDFVSIFIAHIFILTGHAFFIIGTKLSIDNVLSWKLPIGFAIIASLPFLFFISPEFFQLRMINSSLSLGMLNAGAAYPLIFTRASKGKGAGSKITTIAFLGISTAFFVRAIHYINIQIENTNLLQANEITNQIVYAGASISTLLFTCGFILMISQKINQEVYEKAAEISKKDEEKDRFLAMLYHEIKTPLAVLKTVLRNKILTIDFIQSANEAVDEMNSIITATQLADKIENGKLLLKIEEFKITSLIDEILAKHDPKNLISVKTYGSNILISDCLMLRICIKNLIENALRYSNKNSKITLELENYEHSNHLKISITNKVSEPTEIDTNQIFEKYYRGRASRSKSGSGLGLYIVKGFAEILGGNVKARIDGNYFNVELTLNRMLD